LKQSQDDHVETALEYPILLNKLDLEKVAKELAAADDRARRTRRTFAALERDRSNIQNELETLRETRERNLKVAKAVGKRAGLAAQPAPAQKLQDARATLENERRRLFSLAADEFRTYFHPTRTRRTQETH
jgi:predicted  nucleic acid-binding Zn-ribbon protein